jgi:hypothetical protein
MTTPSRRAVTSTTRFGVLGPAVIRCGPVAAMCLCLAACATRADTDGSGAGRPQDLRATVHVSDTLRTVTLSQSLRDVATGLARADTLRPDLDLGGTPGTEFGYIADAAVMRDGTMAVLDRLNAEVWLFSASGQPIKRFGGKGNGPGELHSPVAIAALRHDWVVLDPRLRNTFTAYDSSGRYVTSFNAPVEGDWQLMEHFPFVTVSGIREGQEDLARRLVPYDDTTLIVQVEGDIGRAAIAGVAFPFDAPPVQLVRIDLHGRVLDTAAVMTGAPLGHELPYYEPFYAPHPIVATGAGWIATAQGDRAAIDVHFTDARTSTRVTWPAVRIAIGADERQAVMRHYVAVETKLSDQAARILASRTPKEEADVERQMMDVWPVAAEAPQVTTAFGAGECLWLAGWNPADALDGTASTWAVLDVRADSIVRVVRIPRPDSRVRAVSPAAAYSTYFDSLGVSHLERYPVGMPECGDGR